MIATLILIPSVNPAIGKAEAILKAEHARVLGVRAIEAALEVVDTADAVT